MSDADHATHKATARDALIAELLGDVGKLDDTVKQMLAEVKALPNALPLDLKDTLRKFEGQYDRFLVQSVEASKIYGDAVLKEVESIANITAAAIANENKKMMDNHIKQLVAAVQQNAPSSQDYDAQRIAPQNLEVSSMWTWMLCIIMLSIGAGGMWLWLKFFPH